MKRIFTIMLTCILAVTLTGCTEEKKSQENTTVGGVPIQGSVEHPVYSVGVNKHQSVMWSADDMGGAFRVTVEYGIGKVDYELQYSDKTGFKNCNMYIEAATSTTAVKFLNDIGYDYTLADLSAADGGLYVCFTDAPLLAGFDKSLSQDAAYSALLKALNVELPTSSSTNNYNPEPSTEYLGVTVHNFVMNIGDTQQIEFTNVPSGINQEDCLFETTDARVCEVSSTGLLTAKQSGYVTIIVSTPAASFTSQFTLEVKNPDALVVTPTVKE